MAQYITSTLIENKGDKEHDFEFDADTIKPDMVLRIGGLSIHFTAERMKALGEFIVSNTSHVPAPKAKCPGYCCTNTLGPDSGIIDGDRYCADCVANEAEVAGREERKINAELFARFGGDV